MGENLKNNLNLLETNLKTRLNNIDYIKEQNSILLEKLSKLEIITITEELYKISSELKTIIKPKKTYQPKCNNWYFCHHYLIFLFFSFLQE